MAKYGVAVNVIGTHAKSIRVAECCPWRPRRQEARI
jgi:hypothetical protein